MEIQDILKKTIVIIGGGIAGISAALELADAGYKVTLLEMREELLKGSSDNTPCRIGACFHYPNKETAIHALRNIIPFLKKYSTFLLKTEESLTGTNYVIVKNSTYDYSEIKEIYSAVINEYKRLIQEDISNKVLGDPDELIQELDEIPSYINSELCSKVLRINERILDWGAFRQHLIKTIENHPMITIHKKASVTQLGYGQTTSKQLYQVTYYENGDANNPLTMAADCIINCTWQNSEAINATMGFLYVKDERTCRLKAMAKIKLPSSLSGSRSAFYGFGPHCAITSIDKDKAYLTFEPVTNMAFTTNLSMPKEIEYWDTSGNQLSIDEKTRQENKRSQEKYQIGRDIITGASQYINGLEDSILEDVSFGIVKTPGIVNIYSGDSKHNWRIADGLSAEALCYLTIQSMKLLNGVKNAQTMLSIIQKEHFAHADMLHTVFEKSLTEEKNNKKSSLEDKKKQIMKINISRNYSYFFSDSMNLNNLSETIDQLIENKEIIAIEISKRRKRHIIN